MELYNFNLGRDFVADCSLIVVDEKDPSIFKEITANRFFLTIISQSLGKLFHGVHHKDLRMIIEKEGISSKILDDIKDVIYPTREIKVINVELFSNLIDALYEGNPVTFITQQECEDIFNILYMCDKFHISNIPYMQIIKGIKPDIKYFDILVNFLCQINELNEHNIPLLCSWMDDNTDLSVIKNTDYADKLLQIIKCKVILIGDNTITISNYMTGEIIKKIKFNWHIVSSSVSPVAQMIAVSEEADKISILSAATLEKITTLDLEKSSYYVSFAPDGKRLAIINGTGVLHVYNCADWKPIYSSKLLDLVCTRPIDWSVDGKLIAFSGYENNLVIIDAHNGNILLEKGVWEDIPTSGQLVRFSSDGSLIAYVSDEDTIKILSRDEWTTVSKIKQLNIKYIDISPDGKRICISDNNENIIIRDIISGAILHKELYNHTSFAFSPNGESLLIAGRIPVMWHLKEESEYKKFYVLKFDNKLESVVSAVFLA